MTMPETQSPPQPEAAAEPEVASINPAHWERVEPDPETGAVPPAAEEPVTADQVRQIVREELATYLATQPAPPAPGGGDGGGQTQS